MPGRGTAAPRMTGLPGRCARRRDTRHAGQPRAHLDGLRLAQALHVGAQAAAFVVQRGDARARHRRGDPCNAPICAAWRFSNSAASTALGVSRMGAGCAQGMARRRLRALPVEPLAGDPHGADITDGPPAVGARVRDGGARPRLPERLLWLGHRAARPSPKPRSQGWRSGPRCPARSTMACAVDRTTDGSATAP